MVFLHEPFQRHGVPHDDTIIECADFLDGFLHVIERLNLFRPLVFLDEIVTETAFMHDDGVAGKASDILNFYGFVGGGDDAMGEELYNVVAEDGVAMSELGVHSEHEVRLALSQVVLCIERRHQLDDVGHVQLFEDKFQQVDIITVGFAILVEEHVRP